MLLGLVAGQPDTVTRLVIQDEVILRIPIAPIRGAMLSGPEKVDFIFRNRVRVRAQFEEGCTALDFYAGFYIQPRGDQLCAGRDAIHSRMGGSCTIERFRMLEPRLDR